jgi:hypothetical protein
VRKLIGLLVLGLGGLAAAIGLTVGALALAGDDVGAVVQPRVAPSPGRSSASTPSPSPRCDRESPTASPSVDDHGGDRPGSDDGSGSNSGPGSTNSGSGSSGSGSSGSGSDDD